MRFRARALRSQIQFLTSALPPLTSLGPNKALTSALLLSTTSLRISSSPSTAQIAGYLSVDMECIFNEFKIESRENNGILLEFDPYHLTLALKSLLQSTAPQISVKLSKKSGQPYLVFETHATHSSLSDGSQSGMQVAKISHDIPVKIMKISDDLQAHQPPPLPPPLVSLFITPTSHQLLKTTIEKLKALPLAYCASSSSNIHITLTMAGEMTMSTEHDGFATKVFFENMGPDFERCKAGRDYKLDALRKLRNLGEDDPDPTDVDPASIADDPSAAVTVAIQPDVLSKLYKWHTYLSKHVKEVSLAVHQTVAGAQVVVLRCEFLRERCGRDGGEVLFYAGVDYEEQDDEEDEEETERLPEGDN
jgi:hypothetical protein